VDFLLDVGRDAIEALTGGLEGELWEVLSLTLIVGVVATAIGVAIGVPLGTALGLWRFPGRRPLLVAVNTGMGIPPVLAGLFFLLLLWGDGPFGAWGMLFTPAAMILAQATLAIPIAAGVTAGAIGGLPAAAREQLRALRLSRLRTAGVAVREAWPGVAAGVAAAFGRVISEVGAVLVVGGNIRGETRVLTTAIVQESRQANFGAALALGLVLLVLALTVNFALTWFQLQDHPA
jgi:tungstate transport system permease protein